MKKVLGILILALALALPAFAAPASSIQIKNGAAQLKQALEQLPYAKEGNGPVMYVFEFTECPYCQQLYKDYNGTIPGVEARHIFYAVSQRSANETAALGQSRNIKDYHAFMKRQKVAPPANSTDASIDAYNAVQSALTGVILPTLQQNGWRNASLVSPTFIWEENGKLYVDGGYRKDHFETVLASVKGGGSAPAAVASNKAANSASPKVPAPQLAWRDLVGHPERWPAKTHLVVGFVVEGENLNAGTPVGIYNVTANEVEVALPRGYTIVLGQEDTNLLADANTYWASLTPEQRQLTLPAIAADRSLWPAKVKIIEPVRFGSLQLNEGLEVPLVEVRGTEVGVSDKRSRDLLFLEANYTDLFSRARELAALPADQRPGMMGQILKGLTLDKTGKPSAVKDARYYVFYFSASTCPRCEIFTPKIVEHFNKNYANRNDVAFVTWPTEATTPPMLAYMQRQNVPWPTLPAEATQGGRIEMLINKKGVFEIPGILVYDRYTNMLLTTSQMPGQPLDVASTALGQLDRILKK